MTISPCGIVGNTGKRRKCWLPAFSSFPTVFSKAFFFRVFKSRDCVVKSLKRHNKMNLSLSQMTKNKMTIFHPLHEMQMFESSMFESAFKDRGSKDQISIRKINKK